MDLLEWKRKQREEATAPLAARMRPKTLDDFMGQDAIVGPGRLLRRAIQADQLSSLLFFGPPGTGKTTLARIIANTTRAHFISLNAVLSGVKDIRASIAEAQMRRDASDQRTILFVDEVHRFNKAQQDALLPWVENGTVILIGATTENPYFEVNKALVSRSRIFQLKSLDEAALQKVVHRALEDRERGYGDRQVELAPEALSHLVNIANGDARALLNALELAIETTPPDAEGRIWIPLEVAEESIQRRAVLYDKEGDAHFDTISAFIKSLRGSDPDAALYWLGRMVYAGEDPRFLFRRMLILASEDVGLADPQAIAVVEACARAFDRVGMPEGRFHLAQATLYLACAKKSNSTLGFFDALRAVQQEQEDEVPNHLKDASRDKKGFGHGAGYLYPHAYKDHWVAQQYLPESLQGKLFYQPSDQGWEAEVQVQVARQREAQLAALLEGGLSGPGEFLTSSPQDRRSERWLQRTLGQVGQQLAERRSWLFEKAGLQRHHVVLDLRAGSGLLTWEALRQTPEGGVYAQVQEPHHARALEEQSQALTALQRPTILCCALEELASSLEALDPGLGFDRILGRNVLGSEAQAEAAIQALVALLRPQGQLLLLESLPHEGQRLYELLEAHWLDEGLHPRLADAEEALLREPSRPQWTPALRQQQFAQAGLHLQLELRHSSADVCITPGLLQRWFAPQAEYRRGLAEHLTAEECDAIADCFARHLSHQVVSWRSATALLWAHREHEDG